MALTRRAFVGHSMRRPATHFYARILSRNLLKNRMCFPFSKYRSHQVILCLRLCLVCA